MTAGIRCLGYAGQKYYLIGELTAEVHAYRAPELLRQPALCELRSAADWKAEAKEGKVDWAAEGAQLLAACQKAGRFKAKEDEKPKRPKPNGALLQTALAPYAAWMDDLQRTDKGAKGNDYNVTVALMRAPELAGKIGWDVREMVYLSLEDTPAGDKGPWSDSHTRTLAVWLQGHEIPVNPVNVDNALAVVGRRNKFDLLANYLNGLVWDGQERIGQWMADYCRSPATPANSIMGSKFLIGAVARAFQPGCKMDTMLVLEGGQGLKKSTAVKILGGEFTSENLQDFHSKDAMQVAGRKWIIEVSELAAKRRSEQEAIKAFITRREDTFRPPYGTHPITVPRSSVLIGNYNPDGVGILDDATGARRYWVVPVGEIDVAALAKDRGQLWAEAVYCYRRGDAWWLSDDEQRPVQEQQADRQDDDPWLEIIRHYVNEDTADGQLRLDTGGITTTTKIAMDVLTIPSRDISRADQMRISRCLVQLGFARGKTGPKGSRINCFIRKTLV